MTNHLSDDDLVLRLYGAANESEHLDSCEECRARFDALGERRAQIVAPLEISRDALLAQRRAIHARLGEHPASRWKWVPAFAAAACLIVAGVFVYHPHEAAAPEIADSQLYSDIYSMQQSLEPDAAKPIHALFEDAQ